MFSMLAGQNINNFIWKLLMIPKSPISFKNVQRYILLYTGSVFECIYGMKLKVNSTQCDLCQYALCVWLPLCRFRSHPPSTPVRRWPLTAVSMTMTLSWLLSPAWHPPWPLTLSPHQTKPLTSGPRRGLASAGSGLCVKTWTCWSATATWSTRTPGSPFHCPTCSSTPSTGACTPDPTNLWTPPPVAGVLSQGTCRFLLSTGLQGPFTGLTRVTGLTALMIMFFTTENKST